METHCRDGGGGGVQVYISAKTKDRLLLRLSERQHLAEGSAVNQLCTYLSISLTR